jgi:hypothetical protein
MTSSRSAAFSVAVRQILVGPHGLPRIRRQDASNSVSTTDVTRHEHPPKHLLRRPSAGEPWVNPPAFDFRTPSEPRRCRPTEHAPDHLAVIQPPTASRLTARCRLRADRLSSCRGTGGGERRCFFGRRPLRRIEPSDTSRGARNLELPEQPFLPFAWAHSHRGTSMRPAFQSPRCLPPEKDRASPLSRAPAEPLPRWPAR